MSDTTKLHLGPCNVYLKEGGADVNIGYVLDGVTVDIETAVVDLNASQLGTTPADKIVTGVKVSIKVPFAEISLENFKRAIASAATQVDTVDPLKRKLTVSPAAGQSLRAMAKKLTIKPIDGGVETTNKERWIIAPLASPDGSTVAIAFGNGEQQNVEANFYCFPDTANGNVCLTMGDETASGAAIPNV
jgi:hypothetical protein